MGRLAVAAGENRFDNTKKFSEPGVRYECAIVKRWQWPCPFIAAIKKGIASHV